MKTSHTQNLLAVALVGALAFTAPHVEAKEDCHMNRNTAWTKALWILVFGTFLILIGCGGAPTRQAPSTTDLLLQSGFQAHPAKSPAHIQKLPGNQFVSVQGQGWRNYVYTDPVSKQLYIGSEAAYQRYQAKAAEAGAQQAPASSQHSMSPEDWQMYADMHGVGP
jgi:hypothetical protein